MRAAAARRRHALGVKVATADSGDALHDPCDVLASSAARTLVDECPEFNARVRSGLGQVAAPCELAGCLGERGLGGMLRTPGDERIECLIDPSAVGQGRRFDLRLAWLLHTISALLCNLLAASSADLLRLVLMICCTSMSAVAIATYIPTPVPCGPI